MATNIAYSVVSSLQSGWFVWAALLILPFACRAYLKRRREYRGLSTIARRLNLKFSPVDLIGLHERYNNLRLIRQGHSRHAFDVLYGSVEQGLIAIFRYNYDTGFGGHQLGQSRWVAVLESSREFGIWQAEPVLQPLSQAESLTAGESTANRDMPGGWVIEGSYRIQAAHAATLRNLQAAQMREAIQSLPANGGVEACGPLLAVVVPLAADRSETDPVVHDRMLEAIKKIADAFHG